ncbi:MAG: hypothetical protein CSA33_03295 [Desulfobulbus propionicus]|nr:MAG: hypothetical protein CSA33_03295 [Desulfobulbus propionicus]
MQTFAFSACDPIAPTGAVGTAPVESMQDGGISERSFASHLAAQTTKQSNNPNAANPNAVNPNAVNPNAVNPETDSQETAEESSSFDPSTTAAGPGTASQPNISSPLTAGPALTAWAATNDTTVVLTSVQAAAYPLPKAETAPIQILQDILTENDTDDNPLFKSTQTTVSSDHQHQQKTAQSAIGSSTETLQHQALTEAKQQNLQGTVTQIKAQQPTLTATQLQQVLSNAKFFSGAATSAPQDSQTDEAFRQDSMMQWSATFSDLAPQHARAAKVLHLAGFKSNIGSNGNDLINGQISPTPGMVTQTEEGQVITVYQSSVVEEVATQHIGSGPLPTTDPSGRYHDTTSKYIHSNLPNEPTKTVLADSEGQLANDTANQKETGKPATGEPLTKADSPFSDNTPYTLLSFESSAASSFASTRVPVDTAAMMRLPSGATVPENAAMDQVIHFFTTNRHLESGSVTLSLHPRELGALRMEIKVDQDTIRAHIVTQTPQAQEALDKHLPRLREALEQQGLFLHEVEITIAANSQYDGSHFQHNEGRHQLGKEYRSPSRQAVFSLHEEEEETLWTSNQTLSVKA